MKHYSDRYRDEFLEKLEREEYLKELYDQEEQYFHQTDDEFLDHLDRVRDYNSVFGK